MTTEDDFQDALDAQPDAHHLRLILADWLEERDDPRAEGYRAMGVLRVDIVCRASWTIWIGNGGDYGLAEERTNNPQWQHRDSLVPADWFSLIPPDEDGGRGWRLKLWRHYGTRREGEDAAAIAFARLPPERRAELLAPTAASV